MYLFICMPTQTQLGQYVIKNSEHRDYTWNEMKEIIGKEIKWMNEWN